MGEKAKGRLVDRLQKSLRRVKLRDVFPYLGLVTVMIFFQSATGRVYTQANMKALLGDGFYILIGAVGYIFIIAQGNLDFSIGGTMGVACAVAALVAQVNPYLSAPCAVLAGIAIGMVNGFVVAKLKLDSFIATMAFNYVLLGGVVILLKGGVIAAQVHMLEWSTSWLKIATIAVVTIGGFLIFNYTAYGKQCRAIGSSEETARQTGVNTVKIKFAAFVIMAALAGLLGFFSLIRTGTASSKTGASFMTNAWNAVLLGGVPIEGGATTKFRGAVIGSMTMAMLSNGMTLMGLGSLEKQFVTGVIFIAVIAISFNRKNLTEVK